MNFHFCLKMTENGKSEKIMVTTLWFYAQQGCILYFLFQDNMYQHKFLIIIYFEETSIFLSGLSKTAAPKAPTANLSLMTFPEF